MMSTLQIDTAFSRWQILRLGYRQQLHGRGQLLYHDTEEHVESGNGI